MYIHIITSPFFHPNWLSFLVYRTNTPEPMVSHKGAIREETDMTAFTSNIKSTSSPPNHLIDKECLRPLNFAHEVQASVGGLLANNHGISICCPPSESFLR